MRKAWACHVVLAGILASSATVAQPMAKEDCEAASAERAALLAAGIQDTVKKGPAWAKSNLPPQKLKEVERYIGLQEQLLFKCGEAKLRTLPLGIEPEDGAEGQAAPKDAAAAKAPEHPPAPQRKKPISKPSAKKAAAPSAEPSDAVPPARAVARAQPKPKPKKADDAYRPPKQPAPAQTE